MSAEHFDAFNSLNYHPLAEVGLHLKYFNDLISYLSKELKLIVHKAFDTNVAILKLFPGINRKLACKFLPYGIAEGNPLSFLLINHPVPLRGTPLLQKEGKL